MPISGRCAALAACALLLVPLAACSNDTKRPSIASAPSASSASASPTSPSFESAPPATSGLCSASPVPAAAVNVTQADGDFNGDGATDSLTVYGTGTQSQPSPYHVRIELGQSAGVADAVIADAATSDLEVVRALGGSEISASAGLPPDGSGAEAFVQVGSGASDRLVGVFQLIGCSIARLTGPLGAAPAVFPIGGSVTHLDGARCEGAAGGARLVQLSATSADGISYDTKETQFTVENGQFKVANAITGSADGRDPRLQGFTTLDCPGVQQP